MIFVPGKGHPILVPNIAISSLQGRGVKEFHPVEEISAVAIASAKSLGIRLVDDISLTMVFLLFCSNLDENFFL